MSSSSSKFTILNPDSPMVLIVGQEKTDRERYRHCLQTDSDDQYIFLEASSAPTALAICRDNPIAGIVVDEVLSDMTGLEWIQMLQNQLEEDPPPIVLIASEEDSVPVMVVVQRVVQAMKLGIQDYLVRQSLTPEQLQLAVHQSIQDSRSRLSGQHLPQQSSIQQLNRDLANRVSELQTLIEITPIGIAISFEPDCAHMQCNAYLRQWLGVSADHNISKSAPPEEQPSFRVFQNGEEVPPENLPMQISARLGIDVRDTEIEIRLPDGTVRQLLSYATPLRGEQNEVRGVVGAFLEITERNRMEAELRDREATIRQQLAELEGIYATAPVGLCFQDSDLCYVRINERLAEINGISVGDHLGHTTREVLPELADIVDPLHRHVLETGEPILNIEVHGTTKAQPDVERDWVASYYPLKGLEGQVLGINVVVQDVSEAKQAQIEREQLLRQLETERSFLEQTLQQMPSGVVIAEAPTGKLLFHNDEAVHLLRHPLPRAETYRDYGQYRAFHANGQFYQAEEYPIAQAVLLGAVVKSEEMQYRRGDDTETILSINAAPIVDRSGKRIAAVSTFEDIAERKQIEAERAQLLAEAESANRSKDEFVAMVAHELRSPLNSILGWAKLLQTRQFEPAMTQKALETIVRNTQAQVQLVEDLLDVSRMVRGTLQLIMTAVNLSEVIEVAVETVRPTAEVKRIQLETDLQSVLPIRGDLNRLQQVVLNLLTNAIKFTPDGGKVKVCLEIVEAETSGVWAQIQVKDTGKGIHPVLLPHVFKRFHQDQQNTTAKQGLGLGLAIVKYLVEMHRGTVTAASAGEGQGATFTVKLPLQTHPEMGVVTTVGEQGLDSISFNFL